MKNKPTKKTQIKLPQLSKTPGPGLKFSPSTNPKVLLTEKSDFELDLKSKHRILKSMVDVDKADSSVQDNSALNYSFKRMSAGMRVLGNYKHEDKLIKKIFDNFHSSNDYSFKVPESDKKAQSKYMISKHNEWAGRRNQRQIRQESSFVEFLQNFFNCISKNSELLKLHDLIIPLITYGVASESVYIERVRSLRIIFEFDDLWNGEVTRKAFVEKLKEDKITSQIIHSLQYLTEEMLVNQDEPFPRLYFSFDTFIKTIKTFWTSLVTSAPIVHISKIAQFLTSKNLVQGFSKSIKFCQSLHFEEFFDISSFERLFLKSIFISQLKNINFGISQEKSSAPMSLKLALFQRKLLINGVGNSKADKSRANLQGAYKFHRKSSSISGVSLKSLRQKVEYEENANKLKIKEIIYEAEHDGCQFVNQDGEIKEGIVNTWDVTNVINSKEPSPKNASGPTSSRKYIEVLKTKESREEHNPYSRNVKIFRDNFLFEKFQKVTNSTIDLNYD